MGLLDFVRGFLRRVRPSAPEFDASKPWLGRQYLGDGSFDDRPNSFNTWHEAFNREVVDSPVFAIEYADDEGVVTARRIKPQSIHLVRSQEYVYIVAHCFERSDERTFRSDRILSTKNEKTGRRIGDLGSYLRSLTAKASRQALR